MYKVPLSDPTVMTPLTLSKDGLPIVAGLAPVEGRRHVGID